MPDQIRHEVAGVVFTADDEVILSNFELLRLLEGNPVNFRSTNGATMLLRIGTPEELVAKHHEACERTGVEPNPKDDWAKELARPVDISALLARIH